MMAHNFCFYLQNRLIQTSQTGGQWFSDTSPFSIPWLGLWATRFDGLGDSNYDKLGIGAGLGEDKFAKLR